MQALADQLAAQKEGFLKNAPPEVVEIMSGAMAKLKASDIIDRAFKEGDTAPLFELPDATGQTVSLQERLSSGPAVVTFYRGVWWPYCNLQVKALQDMYPAIKEAGASLIAISPMIPDNSLSMAEKHGLTFDVLSDKGNGVAALYGIVFRLADELITLYDKFGLDVAGANGDQSFELPVPATYVVDSDRRIAYAYLDVDHTLRMEPADILVQLNKL